MPKEILVFRTLLSNPDSTHHVQSGTFFHAFNASSACTSWIIDSGATKHMTGSSKIFTTYTPCSGKDKVLKADGSLSPISGGLLYPHYIFILSSSRTFFYCKFVISSMSYSVSKLPCHFFSFSLYLSELGDGA